MKKKLSDSLFFCIYFLFFYILIMVIILKKILLGCLFFLVGCSLSNNPTSKVEEMLGKYQGLDKSIEYDYTMLSDEVDLDSDIIRRYEEVIKKQYRNLSYEVNDEVIDGDMATVTVEVEVLDYKKVLDKSNDIISDLDDVDDKVTYTIDFFVHKDDKGKWKLDDITMEQKEKLLGIY